jgi:N-acyl homoserine lactone hydrolase
MGQAESNREILTDRGKSMDFADNYYLTHHAQRVGCQGTPGVADAIAPCPRGLAPADPRAVHWCRTGACRS